MENDIKKSFNTKGEALPILICMDLLKAYARLRIKGLLVKCARVGLRGKIISFIQSFLPKLSFQVKIENTLRTLQNGLSQGSILSRKPLSIQSHDIC